MGRKPLSLTKMSNADKQRRRRTQWRIMYETLMEFRLGAYGKKAQQRAEKAFEQMDVAELSTGQDSPAKPNTRC